MTNTSAQLLAFVGMPGSGKTEAAVYLKQKGYAYVRFGDVAEEVLAGKNMQVTPENEQIVRESLRSECGMAAFAIKSLPKIQKKLQDTSLLIIDGLYSWEEYRLLEGRGFNVILVQVFTEKAVRYQRLAMRIIRPLTNKEAITRDIAEIEHLNKGGPIAIADYLVENNETKERFYAKLDQLLEKII
jgi:dephospho-CoA kinase